VVWRSGWSANWSVVFECRLTVEACLLILQKELPRPLEDVPWNKRGRIYFQNKVASLFHVKLDNFWTIASLGDVSDVAVFTIGQPGLQTYAHWTIYCVLGWMKVMTHSVKSGTRDALLGRILDAVDFIRTVSGSCTVQRAVLTAKGRDASRRKVGFSKTSFKHRSV
jgi:hypothetical protein